MNDEEEAAMEVMQEPNPPSLIEEQPHPETNPRTEQVERGDQFEAFEATNAALVEVEKVDGIEEGREVGDSSSLVERSGEVIVGAEIPIVKDVASLVTVEDSVAAEIEGGGRDDDVKLGESSIAGDEGGESGREVKEEEQGAIEESAKVEEASSVGEAATEGESKVEEDEKLDGGVESQMAMKQDDACNVVEETAKIDEKMGGDREKEEVDGSEVNVDDLLTIASQDCETMEEGNTQSVVTGSKVVKESEIELKEETGEMELEEKNEIRAEEKEVETEKVDYGGEKGVVAGDALVKDERILEKNESEREEEVLPVTMAETEDRLIAGVEDMIAVQKDGDEHDGSLKFEESLPAGLEEEKGVCNESGEVKEVSPFGDAATEGNQVDVRIELSEEEEAPKAKELLRFGEEEKLDGDREAHTDKKQDNGSNVGAETAKINEKMCGDRAMEEVGSSQLNADGLLPEPLQDSGVMEDVKTHALGTETKAVKDSEIEFKEGTEEMVVEETDIKTEDRQLEANEGKEMEGEEEKEMDVEAEKEMEAEEAPKSANGKLKRGRHSKSAGKVPPRKMVGEDVCFICLDGGDLVLCDRRGCPKAYHPSCVDRDEAFFRTKGLWNCGWHLCKQCKKNAYYMCYTCQCSLCKGCLTDNAAFFCVRGSKGLCQTCMKSVILIENNEGNDGMATFDDKSSMDYLFKDYWIEQKENLSLTSDEIALLINRWKRSNADHNQEMLAEARAGNTKGGAVSDSSLGTAEAIKSEIKKSKKRMRSSTTDADYEADGSAGKVEATGAKKRGRRRLKSQSEEADPSSDNSSKDHLGNVPRRKKAKKPSQAHAFGVESTNKRTSSKSSTEWASKELLEFVVHVKNGDKSALSQFDVQELLLEYVKRNKLRDPRQSSQIVCDAMLQKLFGKPRLGHIEMLKLLESHFFVKEDSQGDDNQGSVLDVEVSQLGTDENTDSFMDVGKSRGRKARKRGGNRGLQSNLDDYAAIDMHNINLIYLRRNLIEALMEDGESLHEKVVGSFVRIKIPGSSQKQDIYRLVQVIGTPKAPKPYKVGKRTADCMLEILNLNKTDVIPIDIISNQDFDEDECKRLRQSIKCGFLSRLTVGDVLDKAKDLHVARVTYLLETEITRFNHLCDRASDLGRKRELRECVEKSLLLKTPEERQRRLDEVPVVHADPTMDPSHESEDESEPEKGRGSDIWPRETSFSRREREHFSSRREREHFSSRRERDSPSTDSTSTPKSTSNKRWEPSRSLSGKGFSSSSGEAVVAEETLRGRPWSPARDKISSQSTSLEKLTTPPDSVTGKQGQLAETRTNSSASAPSETSRPPSASLVQNETKISETEKLWHYKDPTGKVQGPFSVVQLRKWNKNGYFPSTLTIWRTAQSENDSILLTEALAGRFEKVPSQSLPVAAKPVESPSQPIHRAQVNTTLKIDPNRGAGITKNTTDQLSPIVQRSQSDPRFSSNDSANRPTSSQSISPGSTARVRVSRWSGSPTPVQLPSTPTGAQKPSSQPPPAPGPPMHASTQQTLQSVSTAPAVSSQNPAASAQGWGPSGYMLRPEMMNSNLNNTNSAPTTQMQGQQQAYSHWPTTPANTLPPPPPPPYQAPTQNFSALPSQVPAAQPNMQMFNTAAAAGNQGVTATQLQGNAGWGQMQQAYLNMGWVAQSGNVGAAMMQGSGQAVGMQSGNMNPGWVAAAANPGVAGNWNNWQQQTQGGLGMVAAAPQISNGQRLCPYLLQGICQKGVTCDFRHS